MKTASDCGEYGRDDFVGRLTDVAWALMARRDVRSASVDRDLEL